MLDAFRRQWPRAAMVILATLPVYASQSNDSNTIPWVLVPPMAMPLSPEVTPNPSLSSSRADHEIHSVTGSTGIGDPGVPFYLSVHHLSSTLAALTTSPVLPEYSTVLPPTLLSPSFLRPSQSNDAPLSTSTTTQTITVTVTAPPTTIISSTERIETTFITLPPSTITTTYSVAPASSSSPLSAWAAPTDLHDLDSFKITKFASGRSNLKIVNGVPASASAPIPPPQPTSNLPTWDNSSAVLQLFYPAGSVNPGNKPQGGSDFYAAPLSLDAVKNVSFAYSVFFPADYDWVKGGKLPGLYGGHEGCSGGDSAKTCFSTRMMWRAEGEGEIYLYVPKDRQADELCSTPPRSICDSTYGLSIGRGSFQFNKGGWTHIMQTMWLNTPGQQDGGLRVVVDGLTVIESWKVYYRDDPQSKGIDTDAQEQGLGGILQPLGPAIQSALHPLLDGLQLLNANPPAPQTSQRTTSSAAAAQDMSELVAGSVPLSTDPLLLAEPTAMYEIAHQHQQLFLVGPHATRLAPLSRSFAPLNQAVANNACPSPTIPANSPLPIIVTATSTTVVLGTSVTTVAGMGLAPTLQVDGINTQPQDGPVSFTGMFFSTFFGGHTPDWASPRDQHTWFKDFEIIAND